MFRLCAFVALLLTPAVAFCADAQTKAEDAIKAQKAAEFYGGKVRPFLTKYCGDCHSGSEASAGVDLESYSDLAALGKDVETWQKVFLNLHDHTMPPEEAEQPPLEERREISAWIETELTRVDCNAARPGHVTIRRLNRAEYANTVRDLLGVEYDMKDFPADDVGYGFDNIGDVLSTPPLLLEKFLLSAERISRAAVIAPENQVERLSTYESRTFKSTGGYPYPSGGHRLFVNGSVSIRHDFPAAGKYKFRVYAFGLQSGDEPVRMKVRLNKKDLQTFDVDVEEQGAKAFEVEADVEKGEHRVFAEFINNTMVEGQSELTDPGRDLIVQRIEVITKPPEWSEQKFLPSQKILVPRVPTKDEHWGAPARETLAPFVTRAYRRPVTTDELDRLANIVQDVHFEGGSYELAMQTALQAILVSPHFLYRVEAPPADTPSQDGKPRGLTDYQLASRLSYFLWSTMPDDELFALAASNTLRPNLDAQITRMLKSERSRALVDNFAMQWLHVRNLDRATPHPVLFPAWDGALRDAMRRETELFFTAVMREDRSILDLLTGKFTFVNEALAKHYGIPGVQGDAFQRVSLEGLPRAGVLTQASVLTVTSNPTRTSPVKRGRWVLEQILGTPPPPPPPNVPELPSNENGELVGTLRQRFEQHRANKACAACHARMDPLGFSLENFDAVGAWRDKDEGLPIDAGGVLPGGKSFSGPTQLLEILDGRKDEFVRAFAEKLLIYALGRGAETHDRCTIQAIANAVARRDYKFSALIQEIVHSEPFQHQEDTRGAP